MLRAVRDGEVDHQRLGVGTEAGALGDDRAQVQPIGQGREPAPALFVAVRLGQVLRSHAVLVGRFHDAVGAAAQGIDQWPAGRALPGRHLGIHGADGALGRLVAVGVLLVAADLALEQQVLAQLVGIVSGHLRGP